MAAAKRFAVFDIDGTLIRWQLYHAVATALGRHGHFSDEAQAAIRTARMSWKRRDSAEAWSAYENTLIQLHDEALGRIGVEQLEQAAGEVFDEYKDQVYIYSRDLIKQLKKDGYYLLAISGSQAEIVKLVAEYYGFDDFVATVYEQADGRFTGVKHLASADKLSILKSLVERHDLSWRGSVAVGDSASDISMLRAVDRAIAVNPEKKLFDEAVRRGWRIVVERKNVVYQLEPSDGSYQLA